METDVIITALKAVGAVIGGALGMAALLYRFRNAAGQLTWGGVFILLGILASTLVGVLGSIAEGYKAKSEAVEQAARTEQLIHELSRSIQPITQLHVTGWVRFPSDSKLVSEYVGTLSAYAQRGELRDPLTRPEDVGASVTASTWDGKPLTIEIKPNYPLWPKDKYSVISRVAMSYCFTVYILKTPINPEDFQPIISTAPGDSDWVAMNVIPSDNALDFSTEENALEIRINDRYSRDLWKSNGKITSIEDLYGAQIIIIPTGSSDLKLPSRFARYASDDSDTLARNIRVRSIMFSFAQGHEIWIDGDKFRVTKYRRGFPAFSIVLPKDYASVLKLHENR
jgi:hypothetical protein